jgi:hypothetical protein
MDTTGGAGELQAVQNENHSYRYAAMLAGDLTPDRKWANSRRKCSSSPEIGLHVGFEDVTYESPPFLSHHLTCSGRHWYQIA